MIASLVMPRRKFPRPRRESKSIIKAKLTFMPLPTMSRELKKFSEDFFSGCLKYWCGRRKKTAVPPCSSLAHQHSLEQHMLSMLAIFPAQPRHGESIALSTVFPSQTFLHCSCSMLASQSDTVPAVRVFSQPGFSSKKPDTLRLQSLPFCLHMEKKALAETFGPIDVCAFISVFNRWISSWKELGTMWANLSLGKFS